MTKEILIKFLNNQCTEDELKEVFQWINSEALKKECIEWGFDDWKSFKAKENIEDIEKFNIIFDKIQQKINNDNKENKVIERKPRKLSVFITWFSRAAAILLFPILAFLFYTLSQNKQQSAYYADIIPDTLEVMAPFGSRIIVQLSDGSKVHLNYGSSLKYPHFFTGNTREVILSGEGYFDVASNPDKPFIVEINKFNVKAVGTSFNVFSNLNKNIIETTLVEGKVILEHASKSQSNKIIGVMEPEQHIKYNTKTGKKKISTGNIEKYIAWKEGKMIFEDTQITEVAEKLSRMYNVNIEVSEDINDYIYTFTFEDMPLFEVLDLMCIATPIKYTSVPRKKLPDGSYTKQKIFIKK